MIEVKHLTKQYGDHIAVSDLSFTIEDGQIYGFLGPNGAGKSTTMNMMTGCLAATEGTVTIDGYDIFEDAAKAKKRIGYLPEIPPLYPECTPYEYLEFVAGAKGIAKKDVAEEIERVMELTQITQMKDRLIKHLSKGYKQRVGIAQALIGDPEVIILDEPTVGLDPLQIIEIRDLIKSLGSKHTVILSSHILSEVQAVCSTILIISGGRMVACDSAENLENIFAGKTTLTIKAACTEGEAKAILAGLPEDCQTETSPADEEKCTAVVTSSCEDVDDLCSKAFFLFSKAEKAILQMSVVRASLEDVFIELTSAQPEAAAAEESSAENEAGSAAPAEENTEKEVAEE